jgi:hypothetical protein
VGILQRLRGELPADSLASGWEDNVLACGGFRGARVAQAPISGGARPRSVKFGSSLPFCPSLPVAAAAARGFLNHRAPIRVFLDRRSAPAH